MQINTGLFTNNKQPCTKKWKGGSHLILTVPFSYFSTKLLKRESFPPRATNLTKMSASPGPPIGWNLPEGSNSTAGVGRQKHKKLKHKKSDKKKKHYNRSSSTTSSSSSSSSSSSNSGSDRHKKGHKYTKLKEIKDRAHKKHKKHKHKKGEKVAADGPDFGVPVHLMQSRANAPETQEAWQARQNVIRRVVDPSTGRERYKFQFIVKAKCFKNENNSSG